jgi:hypothetical protein
MLVAGFRNPCSDLTLDLTRIRSLLQDAEWSTRAGTQRYAYLLKMMFVMRRHLFELVA